MFETLEQWILNTLQQIFDQFGWLGVAGLMVFENATGITPSEVILGLAGWFLVAGHDLPISFIFIGGLYAAVGSLVGASLAYWVARLGGRPLVDRIAGWVRIPASQIDRAADLFQRWGPGLVLFGRMVPGIRTLISIPAGLSRMSFLNFAISTFIGAYIWCTVLIGLGFLMGHEWHRITDLFSRYGLLAAVGFCIVAGLIALIYYARRPVPKIQSVRSDED